MTRHGYTHITLVVRPQRLDGCSAVRRPGSRQPVHPATRRPYRERPRSRWSSSTRAIGYSPGDQPPTGTTSSTTATSCSARSTRSSHEATRRCSMPSARRSRRPARSSLRCAEDERPEHVVFVVQTDGQENSSRDWDLDRIREAIKTPDRRVELAVRVPRDGTRHVRPGPRHGLPERHRGRPVPVPPTSPGTPSWTAP